MILLFVCATLAPNVTIGLLYPSAVSGRREFSYLYCGSVAAYLSPTEFSFGFYGDAFYRKAKPYSGRFFESCDLHVLMWSCGLGTTIRWRFFDLNCAAVRVGGGFYWGAVSQPVAESDGAVGQQETPRRSLGLFMAWAVHKKIGRVILGGEVKINYIPFGSKPLESQYQPCAQTFDFTNLSGLAFCFTIGL